MYDHGRDGYYDENGYWKRTKYCFMSCGHRCTCSPPGGVFYSAEHDKSKQPKPLDLRGISMENVRR